MTTFPNSINNKCLQDAIHDNFSGYEHYINWYNELKAESRSRPDDEVKLRHSKHDDTK